MMVGGRMENIMDMVKWSTIMVVYIMGNGRTASKKVKEG